MTRLSRAVLVTILVGVSLGALGCRGESSGPPPQESRVPSSDVASRESTSSRHSDTPVPGERPRVVFLGDSLTAGFGLSPDEAFPAILRQRIEAEGLRYTVVNAGVSGDTSAGGLSRLDWTLEGDVRALVVALGGNDALRGLPVDALERNLSQIIERAQKRGIRVVLAGMEAPPNFGQSYVVSFHQVYPKLAKKYRVTLVPFLLQDVAGVESLNQRDGIHPTAEGAKKVADNVWVVLRPMLND